MSLRQVKKGYFRLVSEEYFSNVYPNIQYDSASRKFNLHLAKRPQQNFQVEFGGVIASRDISTIFLGLNYSHFGSSLKHFYTAFQAGSFYKSGAAKIRFDFPRTYYLEPRFVFNSWDYLENDDLLKDVSSPVAPTVLQRISRTYGLSVGVPIREFFKLTIDFDGMNNVDKYINGDVFISTDILDNLRLKGYKTGLTLSSNTLNRKQYPSSGRSYSLEGSYFHMKEFFRPGNTSVKSSPVTLKHQWFRLKGRAEQYFGNGRFRSGYVAEAVFSNQPFFQNYFGTIANTPGFFPMQDSRTLILENFRSFNYAAVGLRNIFALHNKIDFRLEGYLFKPFDYLRENNVQEAYVSRNLDTIFFSGTANFVYHSPVGPVSLGVNYYDDDENPVGVLLHVGFLLFNRHPLE
jgi:NTE family protein